MSITEELKKKVWEKGQIVAGYDSAKYRKDQCGAWMRYNEYGDRNSIYGWEIDHITPVCEGGEDCLSNLRPLNWKNNVATSNGRLTCDIKAQGNRNVTA